MGNCIGLDWNPLAASGPPSALAGLLAGFVFTGMIFILVNEEATSRRLRTLSLFLSAFMVLLLASYLAARISADTVCLRAWSTLVIASGLIGLGAVGVFVGLAWMLDGYTRGDSAGNTVRALVATIVFSVAAMASILIPASIDQYWHDSYGRALWEGSRIALRLYTAVAIATLALLLLRWLRRSAQLVEGSAGPELEGDISKTTHRSLAASSFMSVVYGMISAAWIGLSISLPGSDWNPLPFRSQAAVTGVLALLPSVIVVLQVLALPRRLSVIPAESPESESEVVEPEEDV